MDFEVLPASSSESTRPQSPSPERQHQRVGTPRKQPGSSAPSSSGHTPRKDTPKQRKQSRYQCRISGCRDYLADARTRDRHESHYCRYRSVESPELINQTEFPVPPHLELNLDLLQCCVCLKHFARENARKKHELSKHRIFEVQGRAVSPVNIGF